MHSRRERLVRVQRLATRQEQVVAVAQLQKLGFTHNEISGLVDRGYLHRIHRGVYAVGHRRLTRRGWLLAALLACGEQSFLSHRTAAGVRGLCGLNTWNIEVSLIGPRSLRRPGLTLHRTKRPPHRKDVNTTGGLKLATATFVLVQLAATEPRDELARMVEVGVRKRLLRINEMEETVARHPRARGLRTLKAVLSDYRPKPFDKSGLERAIAQRIVREPDIPPPERNVKHGVWELDFLWRDLGVVLEADGSNYHLTPDDIRRDKFKDAKLAREGLTVLRVTDERWEDDEEGALDDLRAVINLARSRRLASDASRATDTAHHQQRADPT